MIIHQVTIFDSTTSFSEVYHNFDSTISFSEVYQNFDNTISFSEVDHIFDSTTSFSEAYHIFDSTTISFSEVVTNTLNQVPSDSQIQYLDASRQVHPLVECLEGAAAGPRATSALTLAGLYTEYLNLPNLMRNS